MAGKQPERARDFQRSDEHAPPGQTVALELRDQMPRKNAARAVEKKRGDGNGFEDDRKRGHEFVLTNQGRGD